MSDQMTQASDHFSLLVIPDVLKKFSPPKEPFDPNGSWENSYTAYSMPIKSCNHVGNLTIERSPIARQRALLNISYEKFVPGPIRQYTTAEMECSTDSLSPPLKWKFRTETRSLSGELVKYTQLEKLWEVKGGRIEIVSGKDRRCIQLPDTYTCNWALYDAVQRLPRQATKPLRFTLFDHFDQLKANHALSFRKAVVVELGGQPTRFYVYEQIGEGVIPLVYWTNDQGRLLFVVSGTEGYILKGKES